MYGAQKSIVSLPALCRTRIKKNFRESRKPSVDYLFEEKI